MAVLYMTLVTQDRWGKCCFASDNLSMAGLSRSLQFYSALVLKTKMATIYMLHWSIFISHFTLSFIINNTLSIVGYFVFYMVRQLETGLAILLLSVVTIWICVLIICKYLDKSVHILRSSGNGNTYLADEVAYT